MALVAAADWQDVVIAFLTLLGVIVNGAVAVYIATRVRTPSGDTLGRVAERTHDNTAALTMAVIEQGGKLPESKPGADQGAA